MLFILINVSSVHVNPNKILIFFFSSLIKLSLFCCSFVSDDPLGGEKEQETAKTEERHGQVETLLDCQIVDHFRAVVTVVFLQLKTKITFDWCYCTSTGWLYLGSPGVYEESHQEGSPGLPQGVSHHQVDGLGERSPGRSDHVAGWERIKTLQAGLVRQQPT